VELKKNLPYSELLSTFSSGMIGLHTMEHEHFGIALVELMVNHSSTLIYLGCRINHDSS
jgi:hypothetical protein